MLFFSDAACSKSGQFDSLLRMADEIRSSDSIEFSQKLSELKKDYELFTINQKYYYLYLTGYQNAFNGNIKEAIKLLKHVEENSQNPTLRYRSSSTLVNLYAFTKNWQKGFEFLDVGSSLYEDVAEPDIRHQGLINAAVFYNELEQYEMALIYVNRLEKEQLSIRNRCIMLAIKVKSYLNISRFASLENDILEGIKLCREVKEIILVNLLRTHLAYYYLDNGEPEKSINLLDRHYEEVQETRYQLLIVEASSILAQAYTKAGDINSARRHAEIVVDSKNTRAYSKALLSAYKVLSEVSRTNKSFEKALEYFDEYIKVKEFLFEQTKARQLAVETAKHRAVEKDNQITLLSKKNRILQLENRLSYEAVLKNRWIIALLAAVASILMLWTLYVRRSQQRFKYLAEYDSLTEICNRAHFTKNTESVLEYYSRSGRTVSIILFDLDNFKAINDTYGHPVGDKVLMLTAQACKMSVRKIDILGRVGGEEFAILLPGCEISQAQKLAEECRIRISQVNTGETGYDIEVTASFGVTDTKLSGYKFKDIVAHADDAMYQAKKSGRNQVVIHGTNKQALHSCRP